MVEAGQMHLNSAVFELHLSLTPRLQHELRRGGLCSRWRSERRLTAAGVEYKQTSCAVVHDEEFDRVVILLLVNLNYFTHTKTALACDTFKWATPPFTMSCSGSPAVHLPSAETS